MRQNLMKLAIFENFHMASSTQYTTEMKTEFILEYCYNNPPLSLNRSNEVPEDKNLWCNQKLMTCIFPLNS